MVRLELIPGKRFEEVVRPLGIAESFPYQVCFQRTHRVDARLGHQVRRHLHPHYEVMLIQSGTYHATINDQPVELTGNGVAILKPGDYHEDRCVGSVGFYSVDFTVQPGPDTGSSASIFVDTMPASAQAFQSQGELHAIAARMFDEGGRTDQFTSSLLDALTLEFACTMMRTVAREWVSPRLLDDHPHHAFSSALLGFFESNLGANLGLQDMAKAMAMSERSLSSRCRTAFSSSPTRLFVRFKMERARALLRQTDRPIKEISRYFGFENPYHFSTVYKRIHGQAPTQDRA